MTGKQRSELARRAAQTRWSKKPQPLPKRERILREIARMTPEEREQSAAEFRKLAVDLSAIRTGAAEPPKRL